MIIITPHPITVLCPVTIKRVKSGTIAMLWNRRLRRYERAGR